jgi:hypothetical protein
MMISFSSACWGSSSKRDDVKHDERKSGLLVPVLVFKVSNMSSRMEIGSCELAEIAIQST